MREPRRGARHRGCHPPCGEYESTQCNCPDVPARSCRGAGRHQQRGLHGVRQRERGRVTATRHSAPMAAVRTFNTAGPVRADRHYQIAPLARIDLEEVLGLTRDEKYFVLHAPRQAGKTSALLALRDLLNGGQAGDFRCLYSQRRKRSGDARERGRGHAHRAGRAGVPGERDAGRRDPGRVVAGALERVGPAQALRQALARWCMAEPRPLVILIDEVDALVGDTLLSVLRQLHTNHRHHRLRAGRVAAAQRSGRPQRGIPCRARGQGHPRVLSARQGALRDSGDRLAGRLLRGSVRLARRRPRRGARWRGWHATWIEPSCNLPGASAIRTRSRRRSRGGRRKSPRCERERPSICAQPTTSTVSLRWSRSGGPSATC